MTMSLLIDVEFDKFFFFFNIIFNSFDLIISSVGFDSQTENLPI